MAWEESTFSDTLAAKIIPLCALLSQCMNDSQRNLHYFGGKNGLKNVRYHTVMFLQGQLPSML